MLTNSPFNFDYSYLTLPGKFYSQVKPSVLNGAEVFLLNDSLLDELNVSRESLEDLIATYSGENPNPNSKSYAQAYSGHQFGHFTNLGDGRAVILGEHLDSGSQRFDIQLKGSGRTPYSRSGDGKATLKAMLREYLISEAMQGLKIPSSKSLAVLKTGETVYRETKQEGAVLFRVMKSHIRVGTFEYAARLGTTEDIKALASYTIKRLYPEILQDENPVISLLKRVMAHQIELVAHWMRVGFIHGVMNTDNTSISAETFDYGPCAFMNAYHPETVFSSIDQYGRYAFDNQPKILKWNMARFAEALLPIIHEEKEQSLQLAQSAFDEFDELWSNQYYKTMLNKIGLESSHSTHNELVDQLLDLMKDLNLDYTNTFWALSQESIPEGNPINSSALKPWLEKWKNAIDNSCGVAQARIRMSQNNPVYIPRNHLVEKALDEAINGNINLFSILLSVVSNPYQYQNNSDLFMEPPVIAFEKNYQTFCGT